MNSPLNKEGFPEVPKAKQGKFTKWVKSNMPGKDTCSAASSIMQNKDKYSKNVVAMANYANNFGCKNKKSKNETRSRL